MCKCLRKEISLKGNYPHTNILVSKQDLYSDIMYSGVCLFSIDNQLMQSLDLTANNCHGKASSDQQARKASQSQVCSQVHAPYINDVIFTVGLLVK